jgi:hypothetical protein
MDYILGAMLIAIGWLLIAHVILIIKVGRLEKLGASIGLILTDPDEWDETMRQMNVQRRHSAYKGTYRAHS